MKKTQLTIITLALTACFLSSCKASSAKAQGTNSSDSLTTTEAQAAQEADTLVVKMDSCNLQEGKNLDVVIRVDYPTGTDDLASNVRKILNQKMADAYLAAVNEDGSKSYKAYAGDLSNAKVVIEKYGKDNFKYLKVITAKRKACGIKNEMRFSDGKTKCAIKKHPSNKTWMLFC